MNTELIHVGFGNHLAVNRVIAIAAPNSAPTKRLIQKGKEEGRTIDLTSGRRTKAVLVMDSGHVILAAITPETIAGRVSAARINAYMRGPSSEVDVE
jgi:extracellular matrix regulatory protein A